MLRRKIPIPFLLSCLGATPGIPGVLRAQQAPASCPGAPVLLRVQNTRGTPLAGVEVRLGETRFTTDSLGEVRAAGAVGVAVSAAVCGAKDVVGVCRGLAG